MIHVAYRLWGGDGFYAKMLGTSMLSMFENTKEEVTVHVMHNDRLTPDNRGKLCYIAGQYNQRIEFHNVEKIAGATLKKFEEVHPTSDGKINPSASWYPLIVHEVFPNLDKIIFLGADTVFNLDVGELWSYNLDKKKGGGGTYGFATVQELLNKCPIEWIPIVQTNLVAYEDYFIDDVMILNPKFFGDNFEKILGACKFIYDNKYPYLEQDALNYLFSKTYLKLPLKFDMIVRNLRMFFSKAHLEKAIYHFAGVKPDMNTDDIYNRLYLEYFMKTPWATADIFGNIGKAIDDVYSEFQDKMLHFTNLLAERKRAFFIDQRYIEPLKNIFRIKDDEKIITLNEGVDKFIEEMIASKGEKIFFILSNPANYFQLKNFLLSQNFVEGIDFINAAIFLSKRYTLTAPFDTKAIVQAM